MIAIIRKIIDTAAFYFKSILALIIMAVGAYVIIYWYQRIPDKSPTVLLPIILIVAGWTFILIGVFLLHNIFIKSSSNKYIKQQKDAEKLVIMEEENKQKNIQLQSLSEEIDRLKKMRIDINSISPTLKLGLLELDCNLTDFYHKDLSPIKRGLPFLKRLAKREYIGVVKVSARQKFGVDLEKLRFRIDSNKIIISGYKSEFQGFQNWKPEWKIKEVRSHDPNGMSKIESGDTETSNLVIEQQDSLMERLENGADLKHINEGLMRMTERFLALLLAPLQKEIIFIERDNEPNFNLVDFLKDHNSRLDREIKRIQDKTV